MFAQTIDGVWFDVGHPSELIRAQHTLIAQRDSLPFPLPTGDFIQGSFISSSANVKGRFEGSVISSECEVGEDSHLRDVLLMSNCILGERCQIEESVLGRNVSIGNGSVLKNVIVGDGIELEENSLFENCRIPSIE